MNEASAATAGYYLAKRGIPFDIVMLIMGNCFVSEHKLTKDSRSFGWPKYLVFRDRFLQTRCSQWDLLCEESLRGGESFAIVTKGHKLTEDILNTANGADAGGTWVLFTFRRNGSCRPSTPLNRDEGVANYFTSANSMNDVHHTRFFYYHPQRQPTVHHVLLFFKNQLSRNSQRRYLGSYWISSSDAWPFASIESALIAAIGESAQSELCYYEEVRSHPKPYVTRLSRETPLHEQQIGNGDIVIVSLNRNLEMIP